MIISNDSDLTEPMRIVRHELGKVVGLLNPHPPAKRSQALMSCKPSFYKPIRSGVLSSSQFAVTLGDGTGAFSKPNGW